MECDDPTKKNLTKKVTLQEEEDIFFIFNVS